MSSYCTWQELAARYKKIAEDYDTAEAQTGFITGASDDIDARLSVRYSTPFNPIPGAIKDIAIDLAYWKMIVGQEQAKPLKEYIDQRLNALVCGSASLVVSGTVLATTDALPWSDTMTRRTEFGIGDPTDFSVSADWIDDQANDRLND